MIRSAASKIASSEREDTQVTAEQPVSTQIKEWVYEIGDKRGNQSSCQSCELLPAGFKEQCSFAEISFKITRTRIRLLPFLRNAYKI